MKKLIAPEARKNLAPAEGRGFRFVVSQPRRGVRLCQSIFRPSGPRALLFVRSPGLTAGATLLRPSGPIYSQVRSPRARDAGLKVCSTTISKRALKQVAAAQTLRDGDRRAWQ